MLRCFAKRRASWRSGVSLGRSPRSTSRWRLALRRSRRLPGIARRESIPALNSVTRAMFTIITVLFAVGSYAYIRKLPPSTYDNFTVLKLLSGLTAAIICGDIDFTGQSTRRDVDRTWYVPVRASVTNGACLCLGSGSCTCQLGGLTKWPPPARSIRPLAKRPPPCRGRRGAPGLE